METGIQSFQLVKHSWIPVPDRVEDRLCAGMTTFCEFVKYHNKYNILIAQQVKRNT